MNDYIIISDSCVDLPDNLAKNLGVDILPLKVTIKGHEYQNFLDERELDSITFYDMLREKELASTAQANPADFEIKLRPFLEKGIDVLYIAFSSALSGTYNSSLIAKKVLEEDFPDRKIICIDSLCASMGQGLFVTYAADMKKIGKSIDEVATYLEDNKLNFAHLFTVSDLGHLRRGGRLSASSYVLGSLLSIKPLLHVSQEGQLKVYGKSRGRMKSISEMVSRMVDTYDREKNKRIYISHGDCYMDAERTMKLIIEKLGVSEDIITINTIGPVIGAHSGVNTLAIFYIGKERFLEE